MDGRSSCHQRADQLYIVVCDVLWEVIGQDCHAPKTHQVAWQQGGRDGFTPL
jgi:hypothetical protein